MKDNSVILNQKTLEELKSKLAADRKELALYKRAFELLVRRYVTATESSPHPSIIIKVEKNIADQIILEARREIF